MAEPTPPLQPDERAAVARLLEVVARWCDDSMTTRADRVQYLLGYVHAVTTDAARAVLQGGRAGLVDGLASSLDHWCAGLAAGAVDRVNPADPFTVKGGER
jgi:hypothetical protein